MSSRNCCVVWLSTSLCLKPAELVVSDWVADEPLSCSLLTVSVGGIIEAFSTGSLCAYEVELEIDGELAELVTFESPKPEEADDWLEDTVVVTAELVCTAPGIWQLGFPAMYGFPKGIRMCWNIDGKNWGGYGNLGTKFDPCCCCWGKFGIFANGGNGNAGIGNCPGSVGKVGNVWFVETGVFGGVVVIGVELVELVVDSVCGLLLSVVGCFSP